MTLRQNKECTDTTRYARNAAQTGSRKTDTRAASSSASATSAASVKVKMRAEGMSLSASARAAGASVTTISEWVKKGALARERLTRFLAWRTSGRQDSVRASIVAFDEMWTYLGIRRGERRQDLWIWTAVVEEPDGVRWRMYEVGGRVLSAFSRLLDRLPGTDRYETDAYPV